QLYRKEYGAAVRFYADAFAADPNLAEALDGDRYNAACAAALAGCGQGQDADRLDARERARLRGLALDWLRADLAAWAGLLDKEPDKSASRSVSVLQHWLEDPDFAGVREAEGLAKLPEAERQSWQGLWKEVTALLNRAQERTTLETK